MNDFHKLLLTVFNENPNQMWNTNNKIMHPLTPIVELKKTKAPFAVVQLSWKPPKR